MSVADLTHEMGLRLGKYNPEVVRTVEHILQVAKQRHLTVGYPTEDPDDVAFWTAEGVQ